MEEKSTIGSMIDASVKSGDPDAVNTGKEAEKTFFSSADAADEILENGIPVRYLAVKEISDEDQFIRQAMIRLFNNGKAPADIVKAEFSPVKTETDSYLAVQSSADIDYSVSIGYDYTVERSYYDSTTKTTRTKTETLTDWRPLSGKATYDAEGLVKIGSKDEGDLKKALDFENAYCLAEKMPFSQAYPTEKPVKPSSQDFAAAERNAADNAEFKCRYSLPGDRKESFHASTAVTTSKATVITARDRTVTCKYGDTQLELHGFACSNLVRGDYPPEDKDDHSDELIKKHRSKLLYIDIAGIAMYSFNLFISILSFVMFFVSHTITKGGYLGMRLPFFFIGIGYFVFSVLYRKKENKKFSMQLSNYSLTVLDGKTAFLDKVLKEKNLQPLSQEEKQEMYSRFRLVSAKYDEAPSKPYIASVVLFGLVTAFMFFFMFAS